MKIIILKNHLLEGLRSIESAISNNANLPILNGFLFDAQGGKISLSSTNLEIGVTHIILGKVIEKGSLVVPFYVFNSIIKNLDSERITIEQKEKTLFVTSDNYEASIQGQDPKEFPIIPSLNSKERFIRLPLRSFQERLAQVIVAVQYSEVRPEISGFLMSFGQNRLSFVGTDGFRLVEFYFDQKNVTCTYDEVSCIIPLRAAQELLKIFIPQADSDMLSLYIDPHQVLFETETQSVISRLVDGHFPDYQAIIPKQFQTEMVIRRQDFMNAIKLTSSFSGRAHDLVLKVGENKKYLELFSSDSSLGENNYRIPVKLKGEAFRIVYNWHYLIDGLRIQEGDEVVFRISSPDRPALIRSVLEIPFVYLLMPIKG